MPTRASKRTTSWVGFKVHVTQTCQKNGPHLITHVETTTAPVSDDARTATLHERLKQKDLLPDQHLVDTGYVDAQLLHRSLASICLVPRSLMSNGRLSNRLALTRVILTLTGKPSKPPAPKDTPMNIVRLMRWLDGEPHAQTRRSALVQLLRHALLLQIAGDA